MEDSPLYSIALPLRFQYVISCSMKSHFKDLKIVSTEWPDENENPEYSLSGIGVHVYVLSNKSLNRANSEGFSVFFASKSR